MKEFLKKTNEWIAGLVLPALGEHLLHHSRQETNSLEKTASRPRPLHPLPPHPTRDADKHLGSKWPGNAVRAGHPGAPLSGQIRSSSFPLGVTAWGQAGPSAPRAVINSCIKTRQAFQSRMCTGNKSRKSCFLLQEMNPTPTGRNYSGSLRTKTSAGLYVDSIHVTLPRPAMFYWYRISKVGF